MDYECEESTDYAEMNLSSMGLTMEEMLFFGFPERIQYNKNERGKKSMKEFMYCFQLDKMTVFEVAFYTLGTNTMPHFSTSAARFIRSKRNYSESGQAQERLLPKYSIARHFYDKWDRLHLHNLTPKEYAEMTADIEVLKARYNYIKDVRDCFGQSARCYKANIPFREIVELSKKTPKKAQKSA